MTGCTLALCCGGLFCLQMIAARFLLSIFCTSTTHFLLLAVFLLVPLCSKQTRFSLYRRTPHATLSFSAH